jgi:hypothetical protein
LSIAPNIEPIVELKSYVKISHWGSELPIQQYKITTASFSDLLKLLYKETLYPFMRK